MGLLSDLFGITVMIAAGSGVILGIIKYDQYLTDKKEAVSEVPVKVDNPRANNTTTTNGQTSVDEVVEAIAVEVPETKPEAIAEVAKPEPVSLYAMLSDIEVYKNKRILPSVKLLDFSELSVPVKTQSVEAGTNFIYQTPSFQTPNGFVTLITKKPLPLVRGINYDVHYWEFSENEEVMYSELVKLTTMNNNYKIPYSNDKQRLHYALYDDKIDANIVGVIESLEPVVNFKEVNR